MTEKENKLDRFKREIEIVNFYTLAQKYGFCSPYCECDLCQKVEV